MLSASEIRLIRTALAVARRDAQSIEQQERLEDVRLIVEREERLRLLSLYGYLTKENITHR